MPPAGSYLVDRTTGVASPRSSGAAKQAYAIVGVSRDGTVGHLPRRRQRRCRPGRARSETSIAHDVVHDTDARLNVDPRAAKEPNRNVDSAEISADGAHGRVHRRPPATSSRTISTASTDVFVAAGRGDAPPVAGSVASDAVDVGAEAGEGADEVGVAPVDVVPVVHDGARPRPRGRRARARRRPARRAPAPGRPESRSTRPGPRRGGPRCARRRPCGPARRRTRSGCRTRSR